MCVFRPRRARRSLIRSELAYFCAMRQRQNMTGGRVALVPARVVSERLGHSDVGVTLNV